MFMFSGSRVDRYGVSDLGFRCSATPSRAMWERFVSCSGLGRRVLLAAIWG